MEKEESETILQENEEAVREIRKIWRLVCHKQVAEGAGVVRQYQESACGEALRAKR
uniref:Uncharacterized protein n=1 Tax=Conchiformibius kuhniae TaxID=211502 RepID=A0A8T9MUI8_9NEIS|nr:hypothetical protein LVJ77_05325 [Conchiformibius kuhniae]